MVRDGQGHFAMSLPQVLTMNAVAIATLMGILWLLSLKLRDVSIVDIGWGLGFVGVGWLTFLLSRAHGQGNGLLTALVTMWGLRLTAHLAWRNHGKPEDYRYAAMRQHHGDRFAWVSLLSVFGLQGVVMWVVSFPLQVGQFDRPESPTALNLIGVGVWLAGFLMESIGDYQLARFKANPANRGRVMDRGLWRYTRHPNYFGDCLVWWGFSLVAITHLSHAWIIVSPAVMTFLLVRVSGVSLLEKHLRARSPEYTDYIRRTSAFLPWRPKSL